MRQDPDVILIGEMRDETTVRTALAAAETGHLVLSTVHALDAPETINRILDFFPPTQQQQARAMLAGTIKGIISQRLVPRADGSGRTAIAEILTMTGRVHDLILDPARTGQLTDVIQEGEYYGMQTFDQALYAALQAGDVSMEDAFTSPPARTTSSCSPVPPVTPTRAWRTPKQQTARESQRAVTAKPATVRPTRA